MKHVLQGAVLLAASAVLPCAIESIDAAEIEAAPPLEQQVRQLDPQILLGTWRDDQNRFWFTIDEIVGGEVRAARFWLAHLKEGHIDGNSLTLTSESCLLFIGCYEYTHVAELIEPGSMDMHGHSETCVFNQGCREEGDVVNHILMRE